MTIVAVDTGIAFAGKMSVSTTGVGRGNAEDVSDYVINISPEETPLLSALPKTRATGVLHEWITDSLAAAAQNVKAEAQVFATETIAARTRVNNYCQISSKTYEVSGTQEAVAKYGVDSELSYQAVKMMKELKRDMDFDLWNNTSSGIADTADLSGARNLDGMHEIIPTAHTGDASYLVAALTGSASEATFNAMLNDIFDDGPSPNIAYMRPSVKRNVSRWTGVATKNFDQDSMKITTVIDIYQSDFGTVRLVMDRYMEAPTTEDNDQIVAGNWDNAAVAFLRPFQTKRLPAVKDSLAGVVLCEYTLEYGNVNSYGRLKSSTA